MNFSGSLCGSIVGLFALNNASVSGFRAQNRMHAIIA